MKIIGISGTNGSGKDTVGQMLAERHGWLFVSGSDILRGSLKEQDLPLERENLRNLSAKWRREYGLGVLVDKAVEVFDRETKRRELGGLAIASLRNFGEADRVHVLGGQVVWVDADPEVRYKRISTRQRSTEDQKTFEQFIAEENAEMQHSGDVTTINLAGVKAKADIFIENNGNDIEAFKDNAEKALKNRGTGL
ncbi:MAG: AAA family ATPase [Candidatus Saccharimonadales bacterium]